MMPTQPHGHLDDETLNAVLDDEATEEERTGASTCADCSARLSRLRAVALALAAPGTPSEAHRRRGAIDAALGAGDRGVAPPTPLGPRRRWRVAPGWAAAAAVVLAGALAVPLVSDLGGSDQGQGGAEDTPSAGGSVAEDEDLSGDVASAPAPPATQPDLGEIELTNLDDLAASIQRDLPRAAPDASTIPPVPTAEAPPSAQEGRDVPEAAGRLQTAEQLCEGPARRRDPSLARLAYTADATVGGRPVAVLAFEVSPPATPPAVRVLVLAADGCAELGSASSI